MNRQKFRFIDECELEWGLCDKSGDCHYCALPSGHYGECKCYFCGEKRIPEGCPDALTLGEEEK